MFVWVCAVGFVAVSDRYALWLAFAAAALVGVGMGAESNAVPYLLTRYSGLERSKLYGYTWSIYAIAGALGPLLAGAVFDHTGSYQATLHIFLAMVLVSGAIFAALPGYEPLLTSKTS